MELKAKILALQKLNRSLKAIQTPKKPLSDYQLLEAIRKAKYVLQEVDFEGLSRSLSVEDKEATDRISTSIEQRRENLLRAARASDVPHKRFADHDRIGPLRVSYRGKKVRVEIGSELLSEFDEADGQKIFERTREAMATLDAEPFERDRFFQTLKDALKLAKDHGRADREGWVAIRSFYTYAVLLRHLHFEEFTKKPETNKFRKYSPAQFVYDLARFGAKGWSVKNEMLRSRTPNMATVAAGKTMIVPDLKSAEGFGDQVSVMRIEKLGG